MGDDSLGIYVVPDTPAMSLSYEVSNEFNAYRRIIFLVVQAVVKQQ